MRVSHQIRDTLTKLLQMIVPLRMGDYETREENQPT